MLLLFCVIMICSAENSADKRFNEATVIADYDIICNESEQVANVTFPRETWSCYNIRVGDLRLLGPADGQKQSMDLENDLIALCNQLLLSHRIEGSLWAALTVNSLSDEEKVILLRNGTGFGWQRTGRNGAAVVVLRCMLA